MKAFNKLDIAGKMKVLLYGNVDGEKYPDTEPRIRKQSLIVLLPFAKEKLREADAVMDEAAEHKHSCVGYSNPEAAKAEWADIRTEWTDIRTEWHKLVVDAEKVTDVEFEGIPMSIINVAGAGTWITDWASGGCGPKCIMGLLGSHQMNPNGFITEKHVRHHLRLRLGWDDSDMDSLDVLQERTRG